MRLLLLAVPLLFFFSCAQAQNNAPLTAGLYPFRCGKKWGFSNSNGAMQIPCRYDLVTFEEDLYIAYDTDFKVTFFDAAGKAKDSADAVYNYEGDYTLLVTKLKNTPTGPALKPVRYWESIYGLGRLKTAAGQQTAIPDTILRVGGFGGLLWTKKGNEEGIYSLLLQDYIIPLQMAPILSSKEGMHFMVKRPTGDFDATSTAGFKFLLPAKATAATAILDNRYFVLPSTRYGDIVYKLNGEPVVNDTTSLTYVREPEGNTIVAWLARKVVGGRYNLYDLYNADGALVTKDIYKAEAIWKNTVLVDYLDTLESHFQYNMRVVDVVTKATLLSAPQPRTQIKENNGFLIVEDTARKSRLYYAGTGKKIFELPYSPGIPENYEVQIMLSRTSYDGTNRSAAFYALRKDTTIPYTVFDANGTVVNIDCERLYDYENRFVVAQKGGKSMMLSRFWKVLLPPVYEAIEPKGFNIFEVTQEGKTFMVDSTGKVLGVERLLPVTTAAFKGWHLMLERAPVAHRDFDEEGPVTKVTIKDATGTEVASWMNLKPDYEYIFTPNGNVVGYSSTTDNSIQVFYSKTQKVESLPYIFESLPESDLPIVLIVRNKKGEVGLLSTLDFKMIVPVGKYSAFRVLRNPERPNGMMEGVFIRGSRSRDQEAETIGFYGINGVAFWKD